MLRGNQGDHQNFFKQHFFALIFHVFSVFEVCGANLTSQTGVITSPNYPSNYPHGHECVWTIRTLANRQILVNVSDIEMETEVDCDFDALEIR